MTKQFGRVALAAIVGLACFGVRAQESAETSRKDRASSPPRNSGASKRSKRNPPTLIIPYRV